MLALHSLIYVVSRIVPGALGLLTTAFLTRFFDPAQYGAFGLALVVMNFGSGVAFDWLGLSFQRFYPGRRSDPRFAPTFIILFLAMMPLTALGILLCERWLLLGPAPGSLYLVSLVLLWAYSWFELVARLEVGDFHPGRYALMATTRSVLIAAGAIGMAWLTDDPVWAAAGMAGGILLSCLLGRLPVRGVSARNFDRALARAVLAFGLPTALGMIGATLALSGARALIPALSSTEQLGYYTAAWSVISTTLGFMGSGIAAAGYSMAVEAIERGDAAGARRQLLDNGGLLVAVLGPATLGIILVARPLAMTLVGPGFAPAVAALTPWIAATTFFSLLRAHLLDHAFQLGRKPYLLAWVSLLAAIGTLVLCVLLIPRWGALGAAIAGAAVMPVSCAQSWFLGRRAYPVPLPATTIGKVAACCAAMAAVVVMLPSDGVPALLLRAAGGAAIYLGAALALNLLDSRNRLGVLLARLA